MGRARVKAPDGRRWLGRVLEPAQVTPLKIALGLTDTATAVGDGATALQLVMGDDVSVALSEGFWLRRTKVMDRHRLEIVGGGAQRSVFTAWAASWRSSPTRRGQSSRPTSPRCRPPSWPGGP